MKFTLAIFAVLAIAGPLSAYQLPSTGSGRMAKDLQDILDLMPLDKILDITRVYLAQDKEVQLMAALVGSPDSKQLLHYVESAPAFKTLVAYVQENGLDIYYLINQYNKFLQIPPFEPSVAPKREISGGVDGYYEDVVSVTPIDEMAKVLTEKLETSEALAGLVKLASSSQVMDFVQSLQSNEFFLKLEKQADQNGLGHTKVDQFYSYFAMIIPVAKSVL